mmetsp:Transcript_130978/g.261279  ORF Transcript_130978/g.261279 Transcript_130978/m.261279 type:complete len:255 (-) Transcript_130978:192-956(-)
MNCSLQLPDAGCAARATAALTASSVCCQASAICALCDSATVQLSVAGFTGSSAPVADSLTTVAGAATPATAAGGRVPAVSGATAAADEAAAVTAAAVLEHWGVMARLLAEEVDAICCGPSSFWQHVSFLSGSAACCTAARAIATGGSAACCTAARAIAPGTLGFVAVPTATSASFSSVVFCRAAARSAARIASDLCFDASALEPLVLACFLKVAVNAACANSSLCLQLGKLTAHQSCGPKRRTTCPLSSRSGGH